MGKANVTIHVDFSKLDQKFSPASLKKGKLAMASQAMLDMKDYIPRKSGNLSSSGRATEKGVEYPGPYARAQFYGSSYNKHGSFTFRKYTTPGTGKRWDLRVTANQVKGWGVKALQAMGVKT